MDSCIRLLYIQDTASTAKNANGATNGVAVATCDITAPKNVKVRPA